MKLCSAERSGNKTGIFWRKEPVPGQSSEKKEKNMLMNKLLLKHEKKKGSKYQRSQWRAQMNVIYSRRKNKFIPTVNYCTLQF